MLSLVSTGENFFISTEVVDILVTMTAAVF